MKWNKTGLNLNELKIIQHLLNESIEKQLDKREQQIIKKEYPKYIEDTTQLIFSLYQTKEVIDSNIIYLQKLKIEDIKKEYEIKDNDKKISYWEA